MALTVTHAKVLALADDLAAAAKGEVLPSDWNAGHTITGVSTTLAANSDYYVSATGSDITGDGSLGAPWATLAHAMAQLAANVNGGGFGITLHVGAGSFAGMGLIPVSGLAYLYLLGAGIASTTITNGPNDLIYNLGEAISSYYTQSYAFLYNGVTLNSTAHFNIGNFSATQIINGQPTNNLPGDVAHVLSCSVAAIVLGLPGAYYQDNTNGTSTCHISGGAGTQRFMQAYENSAALLNGTYTLVGTPSYNYFFDVSDNATVDDTGVTYVGAGSGAKYNISNGTLTPTPTVPGTRGVGMYRFVTGADNTFLIGQDSAGTSYNIFSLNGQTSDAAALGFIGGATGDGFLYFEAPLPAGPASGGYAFLLAGSYIATLYASQFTLPNNYSFGFSSTSSAFGALDTILARDAANILAQRNGVNAQTLRVYNTFTDANNYERGVLDFTTTASVLRIGTQAAGTGTLRPIYLVGGTAGNSAANYLISDGTAPIAWDNNGIYFSSAAFNGFSSGSDPYANTDLYFGRDAAHVLYIVGNSTNPAGLRVYNKTGTSYERGGFDWITTSNVFRIRSEAGGAGTLRIIALDGFTKAGAAANTDLPAGTWALIHDSSGATTKLVYNDAGTLRTAALT